MKNILLAFSIFLTAMLASTTIARAGRATSTNYKVVTGDSAARGYAQSAGYKLYSSTGQPGPIGVSTSTNYKLQAGFVRTLISSPTPKIIDPDISNDGLVRVSDILLVVNNYVKENTPGWNPEADLNADGIARVDDILIAVNDYAMDNWPPFNSQTQPVIVPVGKQLRFYVTASPDDQGGLPTLSISGGISGQSFTIDAVNGKKRGYYQWAPAAAQTATQVTFLANWGPTTTQTSLWLKSN